VDRLTLAAQLRAIADRIEAAELELLVAQADLWRLAGGLPGEVADLAADPSFLTPDGSSIEPDSASVQAADEERVPPEGQPSPSAPSVPAPIEKPGRSQPVRAPAADGQTAPVIDAWQRPYRVKSMQCPECEFRALDAAGLGSHRRHRHGVAGTSRGATNGATAPIREHDEPTERRWPARPTIAERVATRDAGRTRRQGRSVGGSQ
jgi:hypothetical protein